MAKAKQTKQPDGGLNVLNREYEPECPLSKLKLHPENARQGDIGAIHTSFDTNGFYGAVIAQVSTGNILAGNHRYIAATQKGVESIPVMWVDVDDATALRILVSDNRHSDLASYDNAALAEVLERIKLDDTDLGFTGTGWDDEAYQNLLSDLSGLGLGETSGEAGEENKQSVSLSERFGVPPFSVLDARQGYWQERKRVWLALGIKSELGRGGGGLSPVDRQGPPAITATENGAMGLASRLQQADCSKMALHNDPMQRKRKYDN